MMRAMRFAVAAVFATVLTGAWAQDTRKSRLEVKTQSRPSYYDRASREAVKRGLEALVRMQRDSGAWTCKVGYKLNENYHGEDGEHVGVTALACMAFMAAGHLPDRGEHSKVVARGIDFVLRCSRPEDGYITSNGTRMYEHAFATLFLAHVYGMTQRDDVRQKLKRATTLLVQAQNPEGGWRYQPQPVDSDLSVTVSTLQGLRAARAAGIAVPVTTIERAVKYVKECWTPRGFKYQSNMTYMNNDTRISYALTAAGVVSLHSSGRYEDREIAPAIRRLSNYGELSWGKYHYFYGHYYACQALYVHGGEAWEAYYPQLKAEILRHQRLDGSWSDDVGITYATAMACLLLTLPTEAFPIFQK